MTDTKTATPTTAPAVEVGKTNYDPSSRLDVQGLDPALKGRWVRKDQVDRRRAMGYEVVQDATSGAGVKTFTGRNEGTMHATHDLVLMATRRENAEAYQKNAVAKSRARMGRDVEDARGSGVRSAGAASKQYFYGGGHITKGR